MVIMQTKIQKVIIVSIGVMTKSQPFMKRLQLTNVFKENLEIGTKSISVILSQNLTILHRQRLIVRRRGDIQLTEQGKQKAREIIEEIKQGYGKADWKTLKLVLEEKYP